MEKVNEYSKEKLVEMVCDLENVTCDLGLCSNLLKHLTEPFMKLNNTSEYTISNDHAQSFILATDSISKIYKEIQFIVDKMIKQS